MEPQHGAGHEHQRRCVDFDAHPAEGVLLPVSPPACSVLQPRKPSACTGLEALCISRSNLLMVIHRQISRAKGQGLQQPMPIARPVVILPASCTQQLLS